MAANRTVYLLALTGATVFFIAANGVWFAWVLLFLLLLMPIVSLLLSLPQMLSVRLSVNTAQQLEQGEPLHLLLTPKTRPKLPMLELRLRLKLQTDGDAHYEYRYLRHIPREGGNSRLETTQAGLYRCTLSKVRVYDALGLIWLSRPVPEPTKTAVLPPPMQPKPLPDLTAFRTVRLAALPPGRYSEDHDHRPYREGDNVRSIHWKLSQKTDDLIVREPVAPLRIQSYLIVTPPETLRDLQSELAQLRWLSAWLAQRQLWHLVLWRGEDGLHTREIASADDVLPVVAEVCASPFFPGGAEITTPECDWCYRIVPSKEVQP